MTTSAQSSLLSWPAAITSRSTRLESPALCILPMFDVAVTEEPSTHLLVKDRLGLPTISCLFSVVPPLTCRYGMRRHGTLVRDTEEPMHGELLRTLSVQTSLSGFVLCDLVQCVLPAVLVFAVSSLCLWNVHLQHRDARSISCNVPNKPVNC